jgi:hypothetical protein
MTKIEELEAKVAALEKEAARRESVWLRRVQEADARSERLARDGTAAEARAEALRAHLRKMVDLAQYHVEIIEGIVDGEARYFGPEEKAEAVQRAKQARADYEAADAALESRDPLEDRCTGHLVHDEFILCPVHDH